MPRPPPQWRLPKALSAIYASVNKWAMYQGMQMYEAHRSVNCLKSGTQNCFKLCSCMCVMARYGKHAASGGNLCVWTLDRSLPLSPRLISIHTARICNSSSIKSKILTLSCWLMYVHVSISHVVDSVWLNAPFNSLSFWAADNRAANRTNTGNRHVKRNEKWMIDQNPT